MQKISAMVVLPPGALRLVLAATVMLTHYQYLESPFDGLAVSGFFLLSGYWIATLWDTKYSMCARPLLTFYISRAWRIYPLAAIGTIAALAFYGGTWRSLVVDLLILPGTSNLWPINPPLWSLTVEVQFYLMAPLLLLLVRETMWAAILFLAGIVGWFLYTADVTGNVLFSWLSPFIVGMVYARSPYSATASRLAPYSLVATVLIAVCASYLATDHPSVRLATLVVSIAFAPYVAACVSARSGNFDRSLGDLAYPLYIIHVPCAAFAFAIGGTYGIALIISAAAALVLYFSIDRPFERARRRFVSRGLNAGSTVAPAHVT